ncbi:MAG: dTMP kinase [Methylococcales bacterium]
MKLGKMITLEGVEGAGKSTQLANVVDYLRQQDIVVVVTREPGGTALGEKMRSLLLIDDGSKMALECELLLMFAARAQHMDEIIRPALECGQWVVCDRFTDASYAYQAGGRGIDSKRIEQLEHWLLDGFKPDLTLLLDVAVSTGFKRIMRRSKDRIEQENIDFFERVRNTYLRLAASEPQRIKLIDAAQPVDEVSRQIQTCLNDLMVMS